MGTPRARKPKKSPKTWTVLKDTREQQGWWWDADPETGCQGTVSHALDTGDYSLLGYESVLSIERKRSTGEFAQNVTQDRFERELDRLDAFPLPFLILEFSADDLDNFPANSGIPHSKWRYLRTTPEFLWKRLTEFLCTRKCQVVLAGKDGGMAAAERIFRWVARTLTPKGGSAPPLPDDNPKA